MNIIYGDSVSVGIFGIIGNGRASGVGFQRSINLYQGSIRNLRKFLCLVLREDLINFLGT